MINTGALPLLEGLVSYWPLILTDECIGLRHLLPSGGSMAPGRSLPAWRRAASPSYLWTPWGITGYQKPVAIACDVRLDTHGDFFSLADAPASASPYISLGTSATLWRSYFGGGYRTLLAEAPQLNQWHRCILTFDVTNLRFYLNGRLCSTTELFGLNLPTTNLYWGTSATDTFAGDLGAMAIWDRALTPDEVTQATSVDIRPRAVKRWLYGDPVIPTGGRYPSPVRTFFGY